MKRYKVVGVIGEGAYGIVLKCIDTSVNKYVAIKKFKDIEDSDFEATTLRELKMLKSLNHPNIVQLFEAFRRKRKLILVFEYVQCNLLEFLDQNPNGLEESVVLNFTFQLILGIHWCHTHGVIHRDVKPENLLVSNSHQIKLCDFGFARKAVPFGGYQTSYVATRWYRSPELLVGMHYSFSVDIWAVACIMAEMADGQPLFPGDSDLDQLTKIQLVLGPLSSTIRAHIAQVPSLEHIKLCSRSKKSKSLRLRYKERLSHQSVLFLEKMLITDPNARVTAAKCKREAIFESFRYLEPESQRRLDSNDNDEHSPKETPDKYRGNSMEIYQTSNSSQSTFSHVQLSSHSKEPHRNNSDDEKHNDPRLTSHHGLSVDSKSMSTYSPNDVKNEGSNQLICNNGQELQCHSNATSKFEGENDDYIQSNYTMSQQQPALARLPPAMYSEKSNQFLLTNANCVTTCKNNRYSRNVDASISKTGQLEQTNHEQHPGTEALHMKQPNSKKEHEQIPSKPRLSEECSERKTENLSKVQNRYPSTQPKQYAQNQQQQTTNGLSLNTTSTVSQRPSTQTSRPKHPEIQTSGSLMKPQVQASLPEIKPVKQQYFRKSLTLQPPLPQKPEFQQTHLEQRQQTPTQLLQLQHDLPSQFRSASVPAHKQQQQSSNNQPDYPVQEMTNGSENLWHATDNSEYSEGAYIVETPHGSMYVLPTHLLQETNDDFTENTASCSMNLSSEQTLENDSSNVQVNSVSGVHGACDVKDNANVNSSSDAYTPLSHLSGYNGQSNAIDQGLSTPFLSNSQNPRFRNCDQSYSHDGFSFHSNITVPSFPVLPSRQTRIPLLQTTPSEKHHHKSRQHFPTNFQQQTEPQKFTKPAPIQPLQIPPSPLYSQPHTLQHQRYHQQQPQQWQQEQQCSNGVRKPSILHFSRASVHSNRVDHDQMPVANGFSACPRNFNAAAGSDQVYTTGDAATVLPNIYRGTNNNDVNDIHNDHVSAGQRPSRWRKLLRFPRTFSNSSE